MFFIQSLGLILKNAKFFGVLGVLNLDVEEAAGKCISPLTTTERFYAKVWAELYGVIRYPRIAARDDLCAHSTLAGYTSTRRADACDLVGINAL